MHFLYVGTYHIAITRKLQISILISTSSEAFRNSAGRHSVLSAHLPPFLPYSAVTAQDKIRILMNAADPMM